MVSKSHAKRRQDIKTKLMAAIAMLLVSSIMMVSSTYAWFTLSTAPEVTGITTAVGANGNLEMKLQPLDGNSAVESAVGDSIANQATHLANTTWGNLVDLKTTQAYTYGLDQITLNPSKLNIEDDGSLSAAPLATPVYGADGRVSELAENTITGVYDNTERKFLENISVTNEQGPATINGAKGVRAIGVSSGMSDRQLAYRAAVNAATTFAGMAKSEASRSLNTNGAALADIAIKHATATSTETYTLAEVTVLHKMTVELLGNGTDIAGSVGNIEQALIQFALASELAEASDDAAAEIVNTYKDVKTIEAFEALNRNHGNTAVTEAIAKLKVTVANIKSAQTTLKEQMDLNKNSYAWSDFSSALTKLADPGAMQVNGIAVSDLNGNWNVGVGGETPDGYKGVDSEGFVLDDEDKRVSNIGRLVDAVLNDGGIKLIIASGAGVYADIADHCGDYSANVTLSKIEYGGMTVKNLDATMSTKTTVSPVYLEQAKGAVHAFINGAGGSATTAITDFYGYIIDLAFRTNASESNLMLQDVAVDRVYSDNQGNEDTMGGGAYMSFKSISDTFTQTQAKELMKNIRIVFFDTDSKAIIGYARLDSAKAVSDDQGATKMPMFMCEANGTAKADQTIMALEPNQVHELSVMVYLDGETIKNADVAFDNVMSMQGSMNLQFSSSATLIPMDNTALKTGDENDVKDYGTNGNNQTPATPTVTPLAAPSVTGGTATGAAYVVVDGQGYIVVLGATATDGAAINAVTINGSNATSGTYGGQSGWAIQVSEQPTATTTVVINPNT